MLADQAHGWYERLAAKGVLIRKFFKSYWKIADGFDDPFISAFVNKIERRKKLWILKNCILPNVKLENKFSVFSSHCFLATSYLFVRWTILLETYTPFMVIIFDKNFTLGTWRKRFADPETKIHLIAKCWRGRAIGCNLASEGGPSGCYRRRWWVNI